MFRIEEDPIGDYETIQNELKNYSTQARKAMWRPWWNLAGSMVSRFFIQKVAFVESFYGQVDAVFEKAMKSLWTILTSVVLSFWSYYPI